ncbi:PREDICTED: general odorant-binding protein 66-like [Papilio xuthus]|uniref:General odorant-binding protein 66-like n=1 Tax=Papilio xuthus TaxID=66420 RepID=A0AAJ7EDU3_PAPXU|nr:PREDICTED: general odorant-binding protein 66-like [Papilio xuthus]
MLFYMLVLLLANQISISLCLPASSQDESQQCSQLPSIKNPRKCCDIPPVFSNENFGFCNLTDNFQKNTTNGLPDCTKQLCIFKTLKLIKDEDRIDRDALSHFMDVWAEANPDFASIVRIGKPRCLEKQIPETHEHCEINQFVSCIATVATIVCPKWIIKDECTSLKNHSDRCAKYFLH